MGVWLALIGQSAADDTLCFGQPYNRFVRDPKSCDGYFLCRNDRSIFGRCNEGFMFDYETQFCRYPDFVDCNPDGITTTTMVPTTTPAGPIELWICIGRPHNSFCGDPRRCGSYFFCWNNVGHGNSCPRNSWFHPLLNICTNPGNFCRPTLPCDNGFPNNCIEEATTTTSTTMTTPTTTEVMTTTPSGPIELWVCIGRPDDSFTNHPYRCGAYFLCRQLIGRLALCPPRTWFHPATQTCRTPGSFCVPREPCDNGIDGNGQQCIEQTTTTTVAPTTTTTVATTTPSGPIEIWICIGIRHNSFTRHPRRCGGFFLCRNNIGTEGECPRRFWFHPTLHICTSPGNWCRPTEECDNGVGNNCRDSGESNGSGSGSSSSNESGNGGGNTGECNGSGECGGGEITEAPEHSTTTTQGGPIETWICQGMANLKVTPNPYECGTFYLCMGGIGLPVQCPWQEWFNPTSQACEAPGNFCTPTGPCDNGIGDNCSTTEDPIITPTHSTAAI